MGNGEWGMRKRGGSVAAGVPPAVEGGVSPPGIPWFKDHEQVDFVQGAVPLRRADSDCLSLCASCCRTPPSRVSVTQSSSNPTPTRPVLSPLPGLKHLPMPHPWLTPWASVLSALRACGTAVVPPAGGPSQIACPPVQVAAGRPRPGCLSPCHPHVPLSSGQAACPSVICSPSSVPWGRSSGCLSPCCGCFKQNDRPAWRAGRSLSKKVALECEGDFGGNRDYLENFSKSAWSPLNAVAFSPTRMIFSLLILSPWAMASTTLCPSIT
jgi:hypothetical protein